MATGLNKADMENTLLKVLLDNGGLRDELCDFPFTIELVSHM